MRETGRKSTHRLIIEDQSEHQFFGLATQEPDYRVSILVNRAFGINLASRAPVTDISEEGTEYSRFSAKSEFNEISYHLVANRRDNRSLSRNYPTVDYLFIVCGETDEESIEEIHRKLRVIDGITAAFKLDNPAVSDQQILLQIT